MVVKDFVVYFPKDMEYSVLDYFDNRRDGIWQLQNFIMLLERTSKLN